jgi:hypothetical protein
MGSGTLAALVLLALASPGLAGEVRCTTTEKRYCSA